jgi:prephenate dehydrogenase
MPDVVLVAWDDERVIKEVSSLYVLDSLQATGDAVITDVVSTKRVIMEAAIAKRLRFVGGHPMAGSQHSGLEHASANLFDGKPWFLTDAGAGNDVNDTVEAFVRSVGALPEWIDPLEHDRLMAAISHLPQVVSTALMTVAAKVAGRSNLDLAGPGLRDMTRLAASDPELWAQIAASNAVELSHAIRLLRQQLERVENSLEAAEPLNDFFAGGQRARSALEPGDITRGS